MGKYPKTHIVVAAALTAVVSAFAAINDRDGEVRDRYSADVVLTSLEMPDATMVQGLVGEIDVVPETPAPIAEPAPAPEPPEPSYAFTYEHEVQRGDNLAMIFKRLGFTPQELHQVMESGDLGKRLRRIFPGHKLEFMAESDGRLAKLVYTPGRLTRMEYERQGDVFAGRQITQKPNTQVTFEHAVIDHSLFVASQRVGLDDDITMKLAEIFQWDIDFVLDIRKGDSFFVMFEEQYLGDEKIGNGNILAAEFVNQGNIHQAVRYADKDGDADYYSLDGTSMRKAFLRAPVHFTRISSNFNLRRVHPLFKKSMPHRGIDYAAPTGTPVLAAGDGRVARATRSKANGNFVIINHGEQFQTKYLHLSKFGRGIKSGARIKQGQVIGYVGSTGYATGPHLHYEFLVHGVHKNPRTVKLPDARPVDKDERERFELESVALVALLESYKQGDEAVASRH